MLKDIALTSSTISRKIASPAGSRISCFHQDWGARSWIISSSVLSILARVTHLLGLSSLYVVDVIPMAETTCSQGMTICHWSLSKHWHICTPAPMHLDILMRLGCGLISGTKTGC